MVSIMRNHVWFLAVVFILLLSGCSPGAEPFSSADIVFQAAAYEEEPYCLGFVDADGSDLRYIEIYSSVGGMPMFPAQLSDGSLVVFRRFYYSRSVWTRDMFAISPEGRLLQYSEEDFQGWWRIAPVQDSHQVITAEPDGYVGYHLQLLDLDERTVVQTYVTTTVEEEEPEVGTNALQGTSLVFVRGWLVDDKYPVTELVVLNTETGVETILLRKEKRGHLATPAISPDGRSVAYTAEDGIYIIDTRGGEPLRVVDACVRHMRPGADWVPAPSWSPDSRWLVYHRCMRPCGAECGKETADYAIFKVNVETGEEVLLLEGGLNPYWRLDPAAGGGSD